MKKIFTFFLLLLFLLIYSACKNKKSKSPQKNEDNAIIKIKNEADKDYNKSNFIGAYKKFTLLLLTDSTNGEYYYKKAYCESQLREFSQMNIINDYQKAIQFNYNKANSYYNIALSYLLLDNDSLAFVNLENCLRENPNHIKAKALLSSYKKNIRENLQ